MRLCVFEDDRAEWLGVLTLSRPVFDLWCGASSLLARHLRYFGAAQASLLVRPSLEGLCRLGHPAFPVNEPPAANRLAETVVLVNGRWLPPHPPAPLPAPPAVGLAGEQVAYVVLPALPEDAETPDRLAHWLTANRQTLPSGDAGGRMIEYPWHLVEHNGEAVGQDFSSWKAERERKTDWPGLTVLGPPEQLVVDASAEVEPVVVVDTRGGPVLIDRGAVIESFSRLEGPCYVGEGAQVLGARLRGGTVGPGCRVGGEFEASIMQGHSNKYHDGFLGHSYVGEWVNLAAGTQVSDLRNDYAPVSVALNGEEIDTGLTKVGAFIGDYTQTSINVSLNTGSIIGIFCQLLTSGCLLPRFIPSFHRFGLGRLSGRTDLERMLATAATVMRRRGREWTASHADFFTALYRRHFVPSGASPSLTSRSR